VAADPIPPLFVPPALLAVTTDLDKARVGRVADRPPLDVEAAHIDHPAGRLVVPQERLVSPRGSELHAARGHVCVRLRRCRNLTGQTVAVRFVFLGVVQLGEHAQQRLLVHQLVLDDEAVDPAAGDQRVSLVEGIHGFEGRQHPLAALIAVGEDRR
jgi:hypothetical protein